jgi:hypothetical protein
MFRVETDVGALANRLDNVGASQVPFATAVALTRTAAAVRRAEQDEMRRVFDRPTPFSLNAFEVRPATKTKPVAEVAQKYATGTSKPRHWFDPQVYGGTRLPKGFERLLSSRLGLPPMSTWYVPDIGAQLDAHGNMSRGQIVQILSDLGAQRDVAQNTTGRSRRRRRRARYFVMRTGGSYGGKGRPVAICLRDGPVVWTVLAIVAKPPTYEPRFDFFGVAEKVSAERFPVEFDRAFAAAVRTAR